jgi:predicted nucleic acid-binding protein
LILVDSSVWIGYFNGDITPATDCLHSLLGVEPVALGDIILLEVLQGFRAQRDYESARRLLLSLDIYPMLGVELAVAGASNYRKLRKLGVTVRKSVDTIIATFCIENKATLLHQDRDFLPFVDHLGLMSIALPGT